MVVFCFLAFLQSAKLIIENYMKWNVSLSDCSFKYQKAKAMQMDDALL